MIVAWLLWGLLVLALMSIMHAAIAAINDPELLFRIQKLGCEYREFRAKHPISKTKVNLDRVLFFVKSFGFIFLWPIPAVWMIYLAFRGNTLMHWIEASARKKLENEVQQ